MQMILDFLSGLYNVFLFLREIFYRIGIFKRKRLNCIVISVGNITLGGTGKTPFVESLADTIYSYNKKVVLISRGYKRKSKGLKIVSDGKEIFESQENSGDEAYYLAKRCKNIPVIVSKGRFSAGELAINKFLSDCLILDDGFQRRYGLSRDLDIVLIDSTNPFGNYKLFPSGILREPLNKLKDADVFILTKVDEAKNKEQLRNELIKIKKDCLILESIYNPVGFVSKDEQYMVGFVKNKKAFLVSSIGNPFYFERIIEKLDAIIIKHLKYPDHHNYSSYDIIKIENDFKKSKAEFLITTEKDIVKLGDCEPSGARLGPELSMNVYFLRIKFEFLKEDKEKFMEILKQKGII